MSPRAAILLLAAAPRVTRLSPATPAARTSRAAGAASFALVSLVPLAALATLAGCQPQVVEYHYRPAYYQLASETKLPDEVVTEDGRIIRFVSTPIDEMQKSRDAAEGGGDQPAAPPAEIWKESPDGRVTLTCILPEHVLANTMTCLRLERYDVMYEELLAKRTRAEYEASGRGPEQFAAWCAKHRNDLMAMLNRMGFGFMGSDVILDRAGPDVLRARFTPRLSGQFKFSEVLMTYEGFGMKLLTIR